MGDELENSYFNFVENVRRWRQDDLLRAVAYLSTQFGEPPLEPNAVSYISPWGLAAIAKATILSGTSHRPNRPITSHDVAKLSSTLGSIATISDGEETSKILLRLAFEQFPYSTSDFEEWTRSIAIFCEVPKSHPKLSHLEELGKSAFGVPVREVVLSCRLLSVVTKKNAGLWHEGFAGSNGFVPFLTELDLGSFETVKTSLTRTIEAHRLDAIPTELKSVTAKRWSQNPLKRYPLLQFGETSLLAPVPRMLDFAASPQGFADRGFENCGNIFTVELGHLFEAYVGDQLKLLAGAAVSGEQEFDYQGSLHMSIDWFVDLPGVTLLVEAKSRRVMPETRSGDGEPSDAYSESLDKAFKQIAKTKSEILAGNPSLNTIKSGKPLIGVVVTLDNFYLANSQNFVAVPPNMLVISIRELESLVLLPTEVVSNYFLEILGDPRLSTFDVFNSMELKDVTLHNPLLIQAAKSLPGFDLYLEGQQQGI